MAPLLTTLYVAAWLALTFYGALGLITLALYWRHRADSTIIAAEPVSWPRVTVQLPIYNERAVVTRLIAAAARLAYPPDQLEIQVVDDSDDETGELVARLVAHYRRRGINIVHCRRHGRSGYKAGALQAATARACGDFIAIFDADFAPPPDFLHRVIPHFAGDSRLGAIQTRWGHLNAADSALTAAQAIALDKHFTIEQAVRHRAALFPKFNGAAGIWRRRCIEDAGGWHADTICEDLCLSTRAVLRGWRFRYLDGVVAPAELPSSLIAYKQQQARWAKGSLQCLRKFGRHIAADRRHPVLARLYALLAMNAYITQPLLLLLLLLHPLLLVSGRPLPAWLGAVSLLGLGQPLLFIMAQRSLYHDWPRRLRHLPTLLLLAIGTAPAISRALGQALVDGRHPFIRTPKRGASGAVAYRPAPDTVWRLEAVLAVYAALAAGAALLLGRPETLWLPATCLVGLAYVALGTLREQREWATPAASRPLPMRSLSGD